MRIAPRHILLASLLLAAALLGFVGLGDRALLDADEAIYARVHQEAVAAPDADSLTYLGKAWFEKPPLYFWMMRASAAAFGENEFAYRFPAALALVCATQLAWAIARQVATDDVTPPLAAAMLLTMGFFVASARQVRLDIPVAAAIMTGVWAFLKGRTETRWLLGVGLAAGVGIMLKSVIGLLVFPTILILSVVDRRWTWLRSVWFWLGNALGLLLILPWHVQMTLQFGHAFWDSYFFHHIVDRAATTVVYGQAAPFWYHLARLCETTQPWLLLGALLCVWLILSIVRKRPLDRATGGFLAVALFLVLLFHLPKTKLLTYFLPALPFLAIGIALGLRGLAKHPLGKAAVAALLAIGFANTLLQAFSLPDRDFFLRTQPRVSRAMVAEDEKAVGTIFKNGSLPLHAYAWSFFPTLLYYGGVGGHHNQLAGVKKDAVPDAPYLLLVPTPLFRGLDALPVRLKDGTTTSVRYQGPAATLVEVSN